MTSTDRPALSLPRYASRFVGRAAELNGLRAHLTAGDHVVTLVGTAGVGKTRLAREFISSVHRGHGGIDVCFCDLANARTLDDINAAVVNALRIPVDATTPSAEAGAQIGAWLARHGALILVLDNFEQLADHAEVTVEAWHLAAPDVMFVATSRSALRVVDEKVVNVSPLGLAPRVANETTGIALSEAVELVLDRAATVLGHQLTSDDDLRVAAEIAEQLEGLPLAIELAASRLEVLSLGDLRARLVERFIVLRDPSRPRSQRHATLWHAIDWSWTLLTPDEQSALAQASVFAGSFALEAAEAVIELCNEPSALGVLDALQNLCRKSLLRVAREGVGESQRLFWYESTRDYASRRPAYAEAREAARRRHAEYYLSQGEQWASGVDGPSGPAMLERLAAEYDNLVSVYSSALVDASAGDERRDAGTERSLRAMFVLSPVVAARGSPALHVRMLTGALDAAAGTPAASSVWAAHALFARALSNRVMGHVDWVVRDLTEAITIAFRCDQLALSGRFRAYLGSAYELQGLHRPARAAVEIALSIAAESNDVVGEGTALVFLGIQCMNRDDHAEARTHLQRALDLLRRAGHREMQELAHAHLGIMYADEDRPDEARNCFHAAVEISRQLGLRRREAVVLGYLAILYHLEGALTQASEAYRRTLSILRDVGDRRFTGVYLEFFGMLEIEQGDLEQGTADIRLAVETLRPGRDTRNLGGALAALAAARARAGHVKESEALLAESAEMLQRDGSDAAATSFVEIVRALNDLSRATRGRAARDDASATTDADHARRRLAAHARVPLSDVRMVYRVARQALDSWETQTRSWLVDIAGGWFESPGGPRVSLANRPTLAIILAALVRYRLEHAGEALSTDALTEVAWPGTRLLPNSAKNRVRVAISSLRKMGLDALLKHGTHGYRLDPDVPVVAHGSTPEGATRT